MKLKVLILSIFASLAISVQGQFESDVISTSAGELKMFFIGHGTLMFEFKDKVIHIDPVIGLTNWQATEMVYGAKLDPEASRGAVALLKKLYQAFVEFDCDLVEVNPKVDPPVCKIIDYGKYKYEESKKKSASKKKGWQLIIELEGEDTVVEIQARVVRVEDKDFAVKFMLIEPDAKTRIRNYFSRKSRVR